MLQQTMKGSTSQQDASPYSFMNSAYFVGTSQNFASPISIQSSNTINCTKKQ